MNGYKNSNNINGLHQKLVFNTIWKQFNAPLRNFIRKRTIIEYDTEDILQEVFLKIYSNIEKLNKINNTKAWVYMITKNTIIDYYRKSKKLNIIKLNENIFSKKQENISVNKEISVCLTSMINSLPQKYKQAIVLTEFYNVKQKDLAKQAGISISGAKSRVQRARAMLKEQLFICCNLEFDKFGNIIDYKHKTKDCKFC